MRREWGRFQGGKESQKILASVSNGEKLTKRVTREQAKPRKITKNSNLMGWPGSCYDCRRCVGTNYELETIFIVSGLFSPPDYPVIFRSKTHLHTHAHTHGQCLNFKGVAKGTQWIIHFRSRYFLFIPISISLFLSFSSFACVCGRRKQLARAGPHDGRPQACTN